MAGRSTPTGSSPELHIKVQPRPPHPQTKKRFPWLVPTIVIANVFLFFIAMCINDCPRHSHKCLGAKLIGRFAFQPTHENPLLGPSANTLRKMGALDVNEVVYKHEAWRLITCMWLHAGVVHILANMLSLVLVGIRFEQEFGFVRLGLLFVLSGIGGSLSSSLFVRTTISVGASGALFGLLGGMLSDLLINWTIYANKFATLSTLLIIIVFNLAMGILPHVDNFAHLGGFVSGFFLGFVLLIQPHYGWVNQRNAPPGYIGASTKSKYKTYQYVLLIISLILLISAFTVGLIFLLRGVNGNDYCSWCHYLICVPTSLWSCDARCRSNQLGNQLNLTCLGNGKSKFYLLPNGNDTSEMQHLCYQLCS